jgi:hypothetical protein
MRHVAEDYTKYSLEAYTKPFGVNGIEYNEPLMFVTEPGGCFKPGKLLFPPDEIISVRSPSLETEYTEGVFLDKPTVIAADGLLPFESAVYKFSMR